MEGKGIYKDSLLEITGNRIVFQNYYYPSMKPKEVFIENIEKVEMKEPTFTTGKYRFQGTGNLRTWFPLDGSRNRRDKIFVLFLKNQWVRIGFTAEHSGPIMEFFRTRGLLK